ncbi:MAG: N-acetylmuramic acid 6-phosphate etherase [Bacteroidota bacterium]|nr:N-acetylmuramic acid 6-phosphate etherase [Bacteroidota bacterium]
MQKTTESDSNYNNLETMSTAELISNINREDQTVANAVSKALPHIGKLVDAVYEKLNNGGRLFYLGAGTSGRLGILDASECPPTFGVPHGLVIGMIAGGDKAIRKAVEFAEDSMEQGWKDLEEYHVTESDFVVGIAASGSTPYVLGALQMCDTKGISTGCIVCNTESSIAKVCKFPVEIVVGPEFVTGSTRMKAGTAQKLVLNILTTSVMIKMGRVKGNKMVDMTPTNNKLIDRGVRMIMEQLEVDEKQAVGLLQKHGSVRKAIDFFMV